jgi:hypothetical protein
MKSQEGVEITQGDLETLARIALNYMLKCAGKRSSVEDLHVMSPLSMKYLNVTAEELFFGNKTEEKE